MKAKTTTAAWLTQYSQENFASAMRRGDGNAMVQALTFNDADMTPHGWTRVGTAAIELDVADEGQIRRGMIVALRAQQKEIQATAHAEVVRIEQQVQNLLAIDYEREAS